MQITLRILLAVFSFSCVAAAARAEIKPEWLTFGAGYNEVLDNDQVAFASVELRFTPVVAGLRPWVYANTSAEGSFYVGAGLAYTFAGESRWSASVGIGPGYYHRGDDVRLGGNYQNLSFVEVAYRLDNDALVSLRFAHLSNGGVTPSNPGTETLSLQYSIPLGR